MRESGDAHVFVRDACVRAILPYTLSVRVFCRGCVLIYSTWTQHCVRNTGEIHCVESELFLHSGNRVCVHVCVCGEYDRETEHCLLGALFDKYVNPR